MKAGLLTQVVGKTGAEPWAPAVASDPKNTVLAKAILCTDFIDLSSWLRTQWLSDVTHSFASLYVVGSGVPEACKLTTH